MFQENKLIFVLFFALSLSSGQFVFVLACLRLIIGVEDFVLHGFLNQIVLILDCEKSVRSCFL